jgi:rubrerythrin
MTDDVLRELARLTALAERFADEGQMNLNKLAEAAVYAQIRRAGWEYRPKITKESMPAELANAIQALKRNNAAPELVAAMETGLQALQSGLWDDMLLEEAPDVFVCRACGHTALGRSPDHCPDCGAWPGSSRKFVAFFNGDNFEPLNPMEALDLLAENANDLARLVEGLSEETMNRGPAGGGWSIRDHIAHFYDTQGLLDTRVELMLTYDDPDLAAVSVYEFATEADRHPPTARGILEEFRQKREACVVRLRERPLPELYRTGQHPDFGKLTILRQAAYIAYHEQAHLPEIEALRWEFTE